MPNDRGSGGPVGGSLLIEHVAPISGVASHGGRLIATAGYDNRVILWDGTSGEALARGCHDHLANQCQFGPDGLVIASSSSDGSARLWSVPDMRLRTVFLGHEDDVEGLAFDPSGRVLATTSRDRTLRTFDCRTGAPLRLFTGHEADVLSVEWLAGGARLVSSSDDGTIRIWEAESGRQSALVELGDIETDTIAVADDGAIFAGDDLGRLLIIHDGVHQTVHAHDAGIKRVVYDAAAARLITLSYDRSARFWAYRDGRIEPFHATALPPIVWPRSCAFLTPDEVAFVTFGTKYALYRLSDGAWDLSGVGPTPGVNGACFHMGRLYTVGDSGQIRLDRQHVGESGSLCNFIVSFESDLLCGGQMGQLIGAFDGHVHHQHRSPLNCAVTLELDGKPALAVGSYTGEALIFVDDGGITLRATVPLHGNAIKGLATTGGLLFSVCATGAAAIHRVGSWEVAMRDDAAHGKIANGCAALRDGGFVSVSRDLRLRLWDGGHARSFTTPHRNSIKCCQVSDCGSYVATGDYGGRVAIFDLAQCAYVASTRVAAAGVSSLIAVPGRGGEFLATSYDGNVYPVTFALNQRRMAI